MHFIAMLGFTIPGETIRYSVPITLLSMLLSVSFVLIGLLIVGLRQGHGQIAAAWRRDHRARRRGHALQRHGRDADAGHDGLQPRAVRRVHRHRGRRGDRGAVVRVAAWRILVHASAPRRSWAWPSAACTTPAWPRCACSSPAGRRWRWAAPARRAFLLPLIVGVSITTFVLTATIALSPTAAEISEEAELMRRIDSLREQPADVRAPVMPPRDRRQPEFHDVTPATMSLMNAGIRRGQRLAAAVYRVPSEPTRLRAAVWRRLKSLGAIYLQNSAAALPASVERRAGAAQAAAGDPRHVGNMRCCCPARCWRASRVS